MTIMTVTPVKSHKEVTSDLNGYSLLFRLYKKARGTCLETSRHHYILSVCVCMYLCIMQLEQQRQQLLTERQTFHTEQLKQAEMKVRQQREQQGQPGYTAQHSGDHSNTL